MKSIGNYGVFVLGTSISLLLVLLMPELHHPFDTGVFVGGLEYVKDGYQDVYLTDKCSNYPFLGMMASTGVLDFFDGNIEAYQVFLALIDGLNVLLCFLILRLFKMPYALLWSGVIGLLPSSWAGAAIWGQIDGVGQLFILLTLYFLLHHIILKTKLYQERFILFCTLSGLLISGVFLTKQLTIFSVVMFYFILLLEAIKRYEKGQWYLLFPAGLSTILATVAPVFLIDNWLNLNDGYMSHIQHIFDTGSDHMDVIAENGFNLWIFKGGDQLQPSTIPYFMGLTPKNTGTIIYLMGMLVLLVLMFRLRNHEKRTSWYILFLAMGNLGFNVFFTGTHERYLFHFYPFIIMAWYIWNPTFSIKTLVGWGAIIVGSLIYGHFVWQILNKNMPYHPKPVALIHVVLLGFLSYAVYRQFKSDISSNPSSTV